MNEGDLEAFSEWKIDCAQIVLVLRTFQFPPRLTLAFNAPRAEEKAPASNISAHALLVAAHV